MADFIKGNDWSKYSYSEIQNILLQNRSNQSKNYTDNNIVTKHAEVINLDKMK